MNEKTLRSGTMVSPAMERARNRWQRMFYGRETPQNSHPAALAAAITGHLAVLVTVELEAKITGGARARYLQGQLEAMLPQLQQAVQLAAAEGFCILRPRVAGKGMALELIPGSRVYPTEMDAAGNMTAGFFADFRTAGKEELVRLEEFLLKNGTLTLRNRAYRLKGNCLDREIPLDSIPAWQDLEKEVTVEKAPGLLFGVLKLPFANTVDPTSRLPVSLYAGAEQSILEFERLYGEFLYELHSGKRKRILERQALPGLTGKPVPGVPGYQDLSTDTYLVLDPMEQQKPFDDYSPVMRTEAYLTGLRAMLGLIESQCRLSPGTLELWRSGTVPLTATEIISRDKTTYHTCCAVQEQGLRPALLGLLQAMDALADLYGLCPAGSWTPEIVFGDSVLEDTEREFDRRLRMVTAGVLAPEQLLAWYFHTGDAAGYLPKEKGETDGDRKAAS